MRLDRPTLEMSRLMPLPITLYGCPTCEDTDAVREQLHQRGIPFREVNIDADADASAFVTVINGGLRSTPTLVVGEGKRKVVLTEPDSALLEQTLREAGYVSAP